MIGPRVVTVVLAVAVVSGVHADRQTRDANAAQPAGTGRLAGVVVDAQTAPQPVPRAIVMLTGAELPSGRATITDDQGRFAFERLPAGRFALSASKPAYLRATFGALRPGGTGTPIILAAGAQLTDITLTMPHGAAIAGTIRGERGGPIAGLQVSVSSTSAPAGSPPLRADAVNTDDRGAYRIFGLAPGTYVVIAAPRTSGGLGETGIMTTAEVDAALARLRQRGTPAASAQRSSERSPSSIVRPTHAFSTAPVFYPGTTAPASASPITLGLGDERAGLDFVYRLAPAVAVSGTVSGAAPQNVEVALIPEGGANQIAQPFGAGPMLQRRVTSGDGPFTFTNVTPGRYSLLARTALASTTRGAPSAPSSPQPMLFATMPVEVVDQDLANLALSLQPALHVTGRLSFRGSAPAAPSDLMKIRVRLLSSDPGSNSGVILVNGVQIAAPQAAMAGVRADGTFDLDGVIPGSYRISTASEPAGWWLVEAVLRDKDVIDLPFEVGSNDVGGIEITVSDQHSQIGGRLSQADGSPVSRYFVIAFSTDRTFWLPQSRRLRSARPSTDGQYRLDDLPPGEYFVAAITDADSDEWRTPTFLARAVASAVKLTLGDGERKVQDLRIAR